MLQSKGKHRCALNRHYDFERKIPTACMPSKGVGRAHLVSKIIKPKASTCCDVSQTIVQLKVILKCCF